ncbi:hypothetical protein TCAL_02696 [Tigriopus californicus]|uniref:G-protein coupled receptors family 1 profile domain-containing protein n=1 Tax=Tigriopus californicus TaxID=6832 RepID=A0A553PH58_TIGCA|nr:uncharacterized protein LOC131881142 [Tigriopus californicus]TRY77004.1 hypothetical protein TCAL_02696 [Tigriopus californicus]|eukprot:TCALIF_02696-PA protein Name:"Similar to FR FMRFamide receptor (Drosophila melanogaster)" AED:0.41 eAED:0.41 QI:0/0.5/0/0.66/1/1/3/0/777
MMESHSSGAKKHSTEAKNIDPKITLIQKSDPLEAEPTRFQSLVVYDDPDRHQSHFGSGFRTEIQLIEPQGSPRASGIHLTDVPNGKVHHSTSSKASPDSTTPCSLGLPKCLKFQKMRFNDERVPANNRLLGQTSCSKRCSPCLSRFDNMSGSRLFLLQAIVVWSLLCLPGNLVTIVLHLRVGPAASNDVDMISMTSDVGYASTNYSALPTNELIQQDYDDGQDQDYEVENDSGEDNNPHPWMTEVGISDPFGNLTLMSWLMSVDSTIQRNLSLCLCASRSQLGSCSTSLLKIFKTVHFGSDHALFCTRVSKLGFPELCMDDENDYEWLRSLCPHSIGDSFSNVNVTGSSGGRLPCFELHAEYNSFLDSSKYWLEGVGICVVGVFGLCGNVLTIIVLRKSETNRPFNRLLMCLAIADSLLIFVSIGETAIVGTFMTTHPTWYKLCYPYLVHPLKGIVQTATIFMIVAVSAERYKAVCHPLSHRHAPFKFVLMVIFTSIGLEFPRFFQFRLVNNGTHTDFWTTKLMEDPTYIQFSSYWDEMITTGAVPLAALIYFNLCMILKIRASNKFSHRFVGRRDSPQIDTTLENTQTVIGGQEYFEGPSGTEMMNIRDPNAMPSPRFFAQQRRSVMRRSFFGKTLSNSNERDRRPSVQGDPFDSVNNIRSLSVRKSRRTNAHHFQKRREKSTMILVLIVLIFIACHCYRLALKVYEFVNPHNNTAEHFTACLNQQRYHIPMIFYVLGHIHHLVLVLNSSTNFIIYCCVGKEFRTRLVALFCSPKR